MLLPPFGLNPWKFTIDGYIHRDGYVGINTSTPTEALDVNGFIKASDPVLPEHVTTKSYVDDLIDGIQGEESGLDQTVAEHYNQQNQINQSILQALDGYQNQIDGLDNTFQENKNSQAEINENILQALDGYQTEESGLDQTVTEHYNQQSDINSTILKDLDGYEYKTTTRENLTFSVDYNDGSAVTVPIGTVFIKQSDITTFLNGATKFKYIQDVIDALPLHNNNIININLAAGVHRPRSDVGSYMVDLEFKYVNPNTGEIIIRGDATAADWTTVLAAQTITSINNTTGNLSIDVSGTPFVANAYRGYYVAFSTGNIGLIHSNTTSRLYLVAAVSGSPTTARICRPATELRNSFDDINPAASTGVFVIDFGSRESFISVQNVLVNSWNKSRPFHLSNCTISAFRCDVDLAYINDTFSVAPGAAAGWKVDDNVTLQIFSCSFRGSNFAQTPQSSAQNPIAISGNGRNAEVQAFTCYFGGSGNGGEFLVNDGIFEMNNTVIDSCGIDNLILDDLSILRPFSNGTGIINAIRNTAGAGLFINGGSCIPTGSEHSGTGNYILNFENCTGPAVKIGSNGSALFDTTFINTIPGFQNGPNGGNLDVGISFISTNGTVILSSQCNVTGTLGDVRIGGSIVSYTDITANGPYNDLRKNLIVFKDSL